MSPNFRTHLIWKFLLSKFSDTIFILFKCPKTCSNYGTYSFSNVPIYPIVLYNYYINYKKIIGPFTTINVLKNFIKNKNTPFLGCIKWTVHQYKCMIQSNVLLCNTLSFQKHASRGFPEHHKKWEWISVINYPLFAWN